MTTAPTTAPAVEHVEVADPDDPLGMPAYGGPLDRAAALLESGRYRAYTHYADGTEGYATLVVEDDTARVEPEQPEPVKGERGLPAGRLLAAVFGDGMTASHVGGHFSCREAENIAHALLQLGQPAAAATFLAGHAEGDDDPEDDADHLSIKGRDSWAEQEAAARDYLNID